MSLVLADRVRQTSTSTGTGTITLDGTVVGYQSFSAIGNNNTTYYTISLGAQWEVGIGTYYGGTLSRDTVIASSTGSILDLAAGTKDVFVSLPAEKLVQSVNSQIGAVVLTTTNIAEGTNEYFTQLRARTSISAGTGISYDSGTGVITNSSPSLGGDVVGPSSATDNAIVRFDTTTGKLIQNSTATLSDAGLLSTATISTTNDGTFNGITVGKGAGSVSNNTTVGLAALDHNTTGQQNVAMGSNALTTATTANNQTAIGYLALRVSNAADNTAVGSTALANTSSGQGNVAMGFQALTANTTGSSNTALGRHALITNSTGSNITALGNHAGAYETGSNALYIDAYDRTNTAGDKAGALLYGTFNATPSSQTLTINGQVTLPYQTNFNAAIALTGSTGTSGQVLTSAGAGTPTWTTPTTGTVTSVTGTSPVASSGGATPAISLSSGYGDTQNPYASKTANYFLAAPNGSAGAPTFRAVVAADIPTLNQNTTGTASNVTGTVAIANGGTGATDATNARSNLSAAKSGANTDITSIALTTGTISTAPSGGTDIVNKTYADGLAAKWGT